MTRYIAIDGKGGSGKTYLAHLLAAKLNARIFHLDEYGNDYEPFVGIPKLIEAMSCAEDAFVIFEGVGVFDERFAQFSPYQIFVDVPLDIRKKRAEGRDVPSANRSAEEWQKIYTIWKHAESEYFTDATRQKANLIVGEHDGEFDIAAIAMSILES